MSLERVLVHTSLFPSPLSVTVSRFHRLTDLHQHEPPWQSSGCFCSLPATWRWAQLVLPLATASGVVARGPANLNCRHLPSIPWLQGGGARCLPQRGWEGKLTFSAKIGLPESSVRCKNSKCRDPNSARMLLLPAVAQPQLPLKRHQLRHPAGSCGTGWCLLCTGHLSQSSWAPLCGYH